MMSELITMEFARRDDCLDKMVPSDLRQLVGENDALRARVGRLEQSAGWVYKLSEAYSNGDTDAKAVYRAGLELGAVLNETPQQSLAALESAAVEKAINSIQWGSDGHYSPVKHLTEYARQLRQQGGE